MLESQRLYNPLFAQRMHWLSIDRETRFTCIVVIVVVCRLAPILYLSDVLCRNKKKKVTISLFSNSLWE